jgi:toxin ParE1/3/4
MKPVVFHPEAQEEFQEAESYYESQQAGLGDELAEEVTTTILRIQKMPHIGSNQYGGLARSRLVDRFDNKLIFVEKLSEIYLLAVHHNRRRPGYWLRRLNEE